MRPRLNFLIFQLIIIFVFMFNQIYCQQKESGKTSKQTISSSEQTVKTLRFKKFSCVDTQGIGIEAFSMLIPSDWQFDGGIQWVLDNPAMPARAAFHVYNPKGSEEFEVFPNQPFFWTNNQMLLYTFPVGSKYFGNEVHPQVGPIEALKEIILPRFRNNVSNLRIANEQLLPELAKALGAGTQSQPGVTNSAEGAKIRIEYNYNGKNIEEEIYGVVESFAFSFPTMNGTVTNNNWTVDYIFSFKSEKGKLDVNAKLFQTISYSFRINPQWFNKYSQLVEYLIQQQIQQIHNIGQISKIISQTNNEISDMMMDSYNKRQAVNDEISKNFSQYIRGVDEYYNPVEQKSVELPSGYNNAWANSLGEYIVSDSPGFNPNIDSNLNWQQIERKK